MKPKHIHVYFIKLHWAIRNHSLSLSARKKYHKNTHLWGCAILLPVLCSDEDDLQYLRQANTPVEIQAPAARKHSMNTNVSTKDIILLFNIKMLIVTAVPRTKGIRTTHKILLD